MLWEPTRFRLANAEAIAPIKALTFLLQLPFRKPTVLRYDATIVGNAIAAQANWRASSHLLRVARGLARMAHITRFETAWII